MIPSMAVQPVMVSLGMIFLLAVQGNINWGGGTRWNWQNALNLCAGTKNASSTFSCFSRKIDRGVIWQNAIGACNQSGEVSSASQCYKFVQNNGRTTVYLFDQHNYCYVKNIIWIMQIIQWR